MLSLNALFLLNFINHRTRNDDSAFEWFMKSAEKGDDYAQWAVGGCFEHGRGCEIDLVQAMYWYQKSAAQECQHAIDAVERYI